MYIRHLHSDTYYSYRNTLNGLFLLLTVLFSLVNVVHQGCPRFRASSAGVQSAFPLLPRGRAALHHLTRFGFIVYDFSPTVTEFYFRRDVGHGLCEGYCDLPFRLKAFGNMYWPAASNENLFVYFFASSSYFGIRLRFEGNGNSPWTLKWSIQHSCFFSALESL